MANSINSRWRGAQWRKEQAHICARIERHRKADQSYIEQDIQLPELARTASEFYRNQDQTTRAALLRLILPGSNLEEGKVIPTSTPPFDIIHRKAQEARSPHRKAARVPGQGHKKGQPRIAQLPCPIKLPRLDEFRTYCYGIRLKRFRSRCMPEHEAP